MFVDCAARNGRGNLIRTLLPRRNIALINAGSTLQQGWRDWVNKAFGARHGDFVGRNKLDIFMAKTSSTPLEVESANSSWQEGVSLLTHKHPGTSRNRRWLVALGAVLVLVGISGAFLVGRSSSPCRDAQASGKDQVSPEGRILGSYEMLHDFRGKPRFVTSEQAAVASDHGRCADQGVEVMKDGGTAADAAVVTALCQGLHNPMASGIGGGHIMVVRLPNSTAQVIDAREIAPRKARKNMFKGKPDLSLTGGKAIAVPLELQGLFLLHSMHGVKPWKDLLQPAIKLARDGFQAHPYLISSLQHANFKASEEELRKTFLVLDTKSQSYRIPRTNETCCRREKLAQVLEDVAKHGPEVLYNGKYTDSLVRDIQRHGGIISRKDFEGAEATLRDPVRGKAFGLEFLMPPPPSSSAAVFLALRILEGYSLPLAGISTLGLHRVIEAMKHAFAIRMSLGDPGSGDSWPAHKEIMEDVLDHGFAEQLRSMIQDTHVQNITQYGGKWNVLKHGMSPEDHGTSHMSIVDPSGMAVSLTSTINTGFGSKVVSSSTGILLNNQMDDFSTPSQSNVYGIPPSESNYIYPGKKPLSSMSPMILLQGDQPRLVIGASGGPRIISAVLQTILRIVAYGENIFDAVRQPRLHHQLVPDSLQAERWGSGGISFQYSDGVLEDLAGRGHTWSATDWGAVVQAVKIDTGKRQRLLHAASDPRKDGSPSGF